MTLRELATGQEAVVTEVGGEGALRQHFLDMGVIPGARVRLMKFAPMGDPMELRIHHYELTLRLAEAEQITVIPALALGEGEREAAEQDIPHPMIGEEGDPRHTHKSTQKSTPKRDDAVSSSFEGKGRGGAVFALAGNQNCGKTTLFNQLTGSNQHVGNFPGVTVDRKEGIIKGHPHTTVVDLPGIYSLSPYTSEEVVSRRFILDEHPQAIINIADATNIERNLYLTLQLMELGIPMVLALNMMDEVENNGGTIRINLMEQLLGIPVIPISAMKNEGVDEVVKHALHVAKYGEVPARQDFCSPDDHGGAVHRCLHAIMHLIEDHAQRAGLPLRFAATKLVEGDPLVTEALHLSQNERETVEHILCQMEEERGMDRQAAMAEMRFSYIQSVCRRAVVHPAESKEHRRSRRIDRILTGRWTALPSFVGIMALVFWLTFGSLGAWAQDMCETGVEWFTGLTRTCLEQWHIAPVVQSLVLDGVYGGVGTVLSFLPLIVILFFFLSMLEDSGYMARIAFVMDKPLRKLGLSGRSIVPLLIGFGCSVPSVMASRTLPSQRDRKLTVLLTPFMSCTAKIPIYAFFAAAFFPACAAWVMGSLYVLGVVAGIVVALLLKYTCFRGEAVPFVMELPNYRMPMPQNVARLLWDKARDFLQRAFTVIFLASIVIWFLQTFDWRLQMVPEGQEADSVLGQLAGLAAPLFRPLGCGDWRIVTSLISGLLAKEVVVSTLSALFAGVSPAEVFSPLAAYTLLVFCLLYTPCMAAIATIRRELGSKWAVSIMLGQCAVAWCAAWLVHWLFSLFVF